MSYLAEELADALPGFLEAVLLGDIFFNDVPVVIVNPTDIGARILEKTSALLAKEGKCGVVLLILPVDVCDDEFTDVPDGPLKLAFGFQTWELTSRNELATGNSKSAYQIARRASALMKLRIFNGLLKVVRADSPLIKSVPPPDGVKNLRGWDVGFVALEDDPIVVEKVALPIFTPPSGAGTTISIACATAGAAIYYTLDGTPPSKAAGTLYTAPIAIPAEGCTIFAQAYKDNFFPSNLNSAQFTHS